MRGLNLEKRKVKDCIYKKEIGYVDWELAELYVRLKQTMELEIELIKKLDEDLKFIEKIEKRKK